MPRNTRDIGAELLSGIADMKLHREGKLTLRTHRAETPPLPEVGATFIQKAREKLNMSQGVFARKFRISPRTLERWEQGRGRPNKQAVVLILLAMKYPKTLDRLEELTT